MKGMRKAGGLLTAILSQLSPHERRLSKAAGTVSRMCEEAETDTILSRSRLTHSQKTAVRLDIARDKQRAFMKAYTAHGRSQNGSFAAFINAVAVIGAALATGAAYRSKEEKEESQEQMEKMGLQMERMANVLDEALARLETFEREEDSPSKTLKREEVSCSLPWLSWLRWGDKEELSQMSAEEESQPSERM